MRVQTLLLDRPQDCMVLHVDLLRDDEAHLLALYRALPPTQRHEALAWVERVAAKPD